MKEQAVPILKEVTVQNGKVSNKISGLIISVYSDTKQMTLTVFSWQRIVAAEIAQLFDYNVDFKNFDATNFEYVNSIIHAELMKCIVEADVPFYL